LVSGRRSEILAGRAVNASHRNNAEQILAGRRYLAPQRPQGDPHPNRQLVTLPILVSLAAIADVTDPAEAMVVETNAQELTGDWRSYATRIPPAGPPRPHTGTPATQGLGSALFALGSLQVFMSFSATLPNYKMLVVFPDRLKGTPDYLQYSYHDARGTIQVTPKLEQSSMRSCISCMRPLWDKISMYNYVSLQQLAIQLFAIGTVAGCRKQGRSRSVCQPRCVCSLYTVAA
jgi:hypothetical protein